MKNELFLTLPAIAVAALLLALIAATARKQSGPRLYLLPLGLAVAFGLWTGFAIATEGLFGFWNEHVRNAWSNQIWLDLLLAFGLCWALMLPKMRLAGMNPWHWLLLLLCTGSFGLLLATSRYLFLVRQPENRKHPSI